MDILKLMMTAGLDAAGMKRALEAAREAAPDLAPQIDPILAQLDSAVQPQAVLQLAAAILPEAANIVRGQLEPRRHAGDAA